VEEALAATPAGNSCAFSKDAATTGRFALAPNCLSFLGAFFRSLHKSSCILAMLWDLGGSIFLLDDESVGSALVCRSSIMGISSSRNVVEQNISSMIEIVNSAATHCTTKLDGVQEIDVDLACSAGDVRIHGNKFSYNAKTKVVCAQNVDSSTNVVQEVEQQAKQMADSTVGALGIGIAKSANVAKLTMDIANPMRSVKSPISWRSMTTHLTASTCRPPTACTTWPTT